MEARIQQGESSALRRMNTSIRVLFVVCGAVALVLGLLFWIGIARGLLSWHILAGLGVTFTLAVLAILGWVVGVRRDSVALALCWCAVLPLLGFTQTRLLPGPAHWLIEVVHLLVGLGAIALGQRLALLIKRALSG